jgi:AcrR family transcriptional regulator
MQAEEMRVHIMDVALATFAAKGYSNTSVKELAEDAGISQGLMYHYFASKETLLLTIVEEYGFLPQLRQILTNNKGQPLRSVLYGIATSFLKLLEEKDTLFKIFVQESTTNPQVLKVWSNLCCEGVAILQEFMQDRINSGEIKPHNTEVTGRSFFYIMVMSHLTKDIFSFSQVTTEEFINTVLDDILHGIQNKIDV